MKLILTALTSAVAIIDGKELESHWLKKSWKRLWEMLNTVVTIGCFWLWTKIVKFWQSHFRQLKFNVSNVMFPSLPKQFHNRNVVVSWTPNNMQLRISLLFFTASEISNSCCCRDDLLTAVTWPAVTCSPMLVNRSHLTGLHGFLRFFRSNRLYIASNLLPYF